VFTGLVRFPDHHSLIREKIDFLATFERIWSKMRKSLSIITLLCFIIPAISVYTFLLAEKENIKKINREKLFSENNFNNWIKIELTEEEAHHLIEWENDHEFEYNQNMYDVVKREQSGNHLIYWCYQDVEESLINEQLGELFSYLSGGHSTRPETRHLLEKVFKKLYCSTRGEETLFISSTLISKTPSQPGFCSESSTEVPTPPPNDNRI